MGVRVRPGALSIELKVSDRSRKINRPYLSDLSDGQRAILTAQTLYHTHTHTNETRLRRYIRSKKRTKPKNHLFFIDIWVSKGLYIVELRPRDQL